MVMELAQGFSRSASEYSARQLRDASRNVSARDLPIGNSSEGIKKHTLAHAAVKRVNSDRVVENAWGLVLRAWLSEWRRVGSCTDMLNGTMYEKKRSVHCWSSPSRVFDNVEISATALERSSYRSGTVRQRAECEERVGGDKCGESVMENGW
jgi:hypothetical protein